MLGAFRGGYVFADFDMDIENPVFKNPSAQRSSEEKKPSLLTPINNPNWEVSFMLQHEDMTNELGGIGMRHEADLSKDKFDRITLPSFLSYLEINFPHPEFFAPNFTKDIVPPAEAHVWTFTVTTNMEGEQTTICWENDHFGYHDKQLILLDVTHQTPVNMRERKSYTFRQDKKEVSFQVFYGDHAFVSQSLKANQVYLGEPFPNPADDHLFIPFLIPEYDMESEIELVMYDLKGKRMQLITDQAIKAGLHTIKWKRTDQQGQFLPAGIYLIKLTVNTHSTQQSFTQKVWLK